MISRKYFAYILLSMLLSFEGFAQITVSYPSSRAVFQRDKDNSGSIPISGIGDSDISRVEARLVPVQSGQGVLTDWIVIDDAPTAGSFSGFMPGTAGWYVLQLRSFNASGESQATQVERIGIGEVFIISGQSNAQGFRAGDYNANGATEDRVNAYSYYNVENIPENPVLTGYHQLSRDKDIGPHGLSPWIWGEFGDKIVRELNVPVLFFNSAYEGTFVSDWTRSAKGETIFHSGFGFQFPGRTPYSFMGNILKNHVSLMGARAIIWVQGESEGDAGVSENEYYNNLKELIEISREDTGSDINWIVYRTSLVRNIPHQRIINAQNRIIQDIDNVFAGPETDGIQVPRSDGVHLSNVLFGYPGLSEVAAATWRQLDTFFFNTSQPIPSGRNGFIDLDITCSDNNQVVISYPNDDSESILWNGTNSTNSISALSGVYSAAIKRVDGGVSFSKTIDVSKVFPSKNPRVNSLGNVTAACVGGSISYKVDDDFLPTIWQDGSTEEVFTTSEEGDVFAFYKNSFGCVSSQSNIVRPQFVPKPAPPQITSISNVMAACEGQSVQLTIVNNDDVNVIWNTGETSKSISINEVGAYEISARIATSLGCNSDESESVSVNIVPISSPPQIIQNGPYTLGIVAEDDLSNISWFDEQGLLTSNTSSILPNTEGLFKVQAERSFNNLGITCPTQLSGFFEFKKEGDGGLVVYPNPVPGDAFFMSSDQTIEAVLMTLYDSKGRIKFRQVINKVDVPKEIRIKGKQYFGKYQLRLDYNGFFKVFPMVFE